MILSNAQANGSSTEPDQSRQPTWTPSLLSILAQGQFWVFAQPFSWSLHFS